MHFLLGTGTIPLGWGLVSSFLWHHGHQSIAFASLLLGSSGHVLCQQGLMACQGVGWSCCVGSLEVKACRAHGGRSQVQEKVFK